MTIAVDQPARATLWAEFIALFILAPLALWVLLPYVHLFAAIAIVTIIGVFLLIRTPGFEGRELIDVHRLKDTWPMIAGLALVTALVVLPLAWTLMGDRFLWMLRENLLFLGMIWMLYPWFSVLGQEILFRPLFFRRYGQLFPSETIAIVINAMVFALLMRFLSAGSLS